MADWKEIIRTLAPTVATALGGPLAGAAVAAIGSAIGIDAPTQEKIKEAITSGSLTAEQISSLKSIEMQYQNDEAERQFKYAELEFKGVDSARQREVQTGDGTNKVLAFIIVFAFIATSVCVLAGWAKAESVIAGTIIGYVSAKCEQVLNYYFGSTKSSARKTEIIAQSSSVKG